MAIEDAGVTWSADATRERQGSAGGRRRHSLLNWSRGWKRVDFPRCLSVPGICDYLRKLTRDIGVKSLLDRLC